MRFNLNWLLGPREWAVIDDQETGRAEDIYPCLESWVTEADVILGSGLRRRTAVCLAETLQGDRARERQAKGLPA